jgi:hypothetical protein
MTSSAQPVLAAFVLIALLVVFLRLLWLRRLKNRFREPVPGEFPYWSRKTLLSNGEQAFAQVLELAAGRARKVAPKVRLADLVACDRAAWDLGYGRLIGNKHVDFVVVDAATSAILFAVELDDRSHERPARRYRDEFLDKALAAAGIPLIRVKAAAAYRVAELARQLPME